MKSYSKKPRRNFLGINNKLFVFILFFILFQFLTVQLAFTQNQISVSRVDDYDRELCTGYCKLGATGGLDNCPYHKGTLRWSVLKANTLSGSTLIKFDLPSNLISPTTGKYVIQLVAQTGTPTNEEFLLGKPVSFDGTNADGYQHDRNYLDPLVEIVQHSGGTSEDCFSFLNTVLDKDVTIKGVRMSGFHTAILIEESTPETWPNVKLNFMYNVYNCFLGIDLVQRENMQAYIKSSLFGGVVASPISAPIRLFDVPTVNPGGSHFGIYINTNFNEYVQNSEVIIGHSDADSANIFAYKSNSSEPLIKIFGHSAAVRVQKNIMRNINNNNIYLQYGNYSFFQYLGTNYEAPVIESIDCGLIKGYSYHSGDVIEVFGSYDNPGYNDALKLLNYNYTTGQDVVIPCTTPGTRNGVPVFLWEYQIPSNTPYTHFNATATAQLGQTGYLKPNTSEFSNTVEYSFYFSSPSPLCVSASGSFTYEGSQSGEITWDWGDGSLQSTGTSVTHSFSQVGNYNVTIFNVTQGCTLTYSAPVEVSLCDTCLDVLSLEAGKEYIISAWVRETHASTTYIDQYTQSLLEVIYKKNGNIVGNEVFAVDADNRIIIDGWQRIEGIFTTPDYPLPNPFDELVIRLHNISASPDLHEVYFDDIRLHPKDASLKSYVYDPETLRFISELDENNYASFYEYDEDGSLIRVKKETVRGVVTLKTAGNSKIKK